MPQDNESNAAGVGPKPPVVGVIRWDGQCGNLDSPVGEEESIILSYPQFHRRLPFYAEVSETGRENYEKWIAKGRKIAATGVNSREAAAKPDPYIKMYNSTQETVDREIEYAAAAGIGYFAFCWYGNDETDTCRNICSVRNLFLSSKRKMGVKWCPILYVHPLTVPDENWLVEQMAGPDFFSVASGRPVLFCPVDYYAPATVASQVQSIRCKCGAIGLDPYVVAMSFGSQGRKLADLARSISAEAVTWYASFSEDGGSYETMMENDIKKAELAAAAGIHVVPHMGAGWDCRPRNRRDIGRPYQYVKSGYESGWLTRDATPEQIEGHLGTLLAWAAKNPRREGDLCSVLIYSWNEFSEGGQTVCPQYDPDEPTRPNTACIDAVARAVGNAPSAETEFIKPELDAEKAAEERPADGKPPRVAFIGSKANGPVAGPFILTVDFNEDVTGFGTGGLVVINGDASNLKGCGREYAVTITPAPGLTGKVTVTVAKGAAFNSRGAVSEISPSFSIDAANISCPVTFDPNGGKFEGYYFKNASLPDGVPVEEKPCVVGRGNSVPEPKPPVRPGYDLTGWYRDAECAVMWDFPNDSVAGALTLYAGWRKVAPL